ncbi:MAG TPA: hypothetical protein VGN17_09280 [Bryobacteraceae bacterium]
MRAYSDSSQEALRARGFLKDWAGEGFLTESQRQRLEQETPCELRRTNVFLRIVLGLFTLLIAVAAAGLFFAVFVPRAASRTTGVFLLIFAAVSYAAAELSVSRARLYRFGIEEALAACSVGFLCVGIWMAASHGYGTRDAIDFLVPAAGVVASLWLWHRFGWAYASLAAMIFVLGLPDHWRSSIAVHHVVDAAVYTAALLAVIALRPRFRFTYLDGTFSITEALLWLGIYLVTNLQLLPVNLLVWMGGFETPTDFSKPFYWTTWVLIWCLPPVVLLRGLRIRDRFVIAAGGVAAVLTLITNKPYLGWARHTWDPMLLGALLIGVALFLRRWLAGGAEGVRHGFTARRLSGKDKDWMSAASMTIGLAPPHPAPPPHSPDVQFGGGDSGGGGASSDW